MGSDWQRKNSSDCWPQ